MPQFQIASEENKTNVTQLEEPQKYRWHFNNQTPAHTMGLSAEQSGSERDLRLIAMPRTRFKRLKMLGDPTQGQNSKDPRFFSPTGKNQINFSKIMKTLQLPNVCYFHISE